MKKHYLSLFLLAATMAPVAATVPPLQRTFTYQQPDGSAITLTRQGNGLMAYYATTDGYALLRGDDGKFYYTLQQPDGTLRRTNVVAHERSHRCLLESNFAKAQATTAETAAALVRAKAEALPMASEPSLAPALRVSAATGANGLGTYGVSARGTLQSIGAPTIPVVMVAYADRDFQAFTTKESVTRLFNEPGLAELPGEVGSVADYFADQSNGLFKPKFEVVARVKLSQGYAYYGKNATSGAIDAKRLDFVKEALSLAAEQGVDFSKYQVDASGVPLVSFYYAGPGEHASFESGSSDYMWAHFSGYNGVVNGTTIKSYYVGEELMNTYKADEQGNPVLTGFKRSGIGILCHEFGHALGLPDFYYTGSNSEMKASQAMMNFWSVMDYGGYYYDGYAPIGYTAYEKSFMGWLNIPTLTEAQFVSLYPQGREAEGATAYAIVNPANASEYYILENRQPNKWYPMSMGAGMLVTHVDYLSSAWTSNVVNNTKGHPRMVPVQADNLLSPRTGAGIWDNYKGDLFPGTTLATELSDASVPATTVYSGTGLNQPLYGIKLNDDGVVTFAFLDQMLTSISAAPTAPAAAPKAVYSLDGRRMKSATTKGVYIVDGKKVVK